MKDKILKYITGSAIYRQAIAFLKRVKFKRYKGLTLYAVTKVFVQKITQDEIIGRANGVAFNFALAIFPATIFLFTLTPYIHELIPEVSRASILDFIESMMPAAMFETVEPTVEDIVSRTRGGLLTFGALFSLFLATNGMLSLLHAFNACYKTKEKRGFIKMRLVATGLTFMLAFVLILAVLLLVIGNFLLDILISFDWFDIIIEDHQIYLFFILRFVVIFLVFFLAISFMYYFGPSVDHKWRFFSIGSFIATVLCLLVSYGFSFYVSNFATYNKLYGSLGVLIAIMIWQEILSVVLLVGYEVNASIHKAYRLSRTKRFKT